MSSFGTARSSVPSGDFVMSSATVRCSRSVTCVAALGRTSRAFAIRAASGDDTFMVAPSCVVCGASPIVGRGVLNMYAGV